MNCPPTHSLCSILTRTCCIAAQTAAAAQSSDCQGLTGEKKKKWHDLRHEVDADSLRCREAQEAEGEAHLEMKQQHHFCCL